MFGSQAYWYDSNRDHRHIGTVGWSVVDCMHIGTIGWSMYRMHIGTIIVCVGSSTVPAAVVIVVKHRACLLVSRLIVGVQARSFGRWVAGVQVRQLSDSGSSTVRVSGGDSG